MLGPWMGVWVRAGACVGTSPQQSRVQRGYATSLGTAQHLRGQQQAGGTREALGQRAVWWEVTVLNSGRRTCSLALGCVHTD